MLLTASQRLSGAQAAQPRPEPKATQRVSLALNAQPAVAAAPESSLSPPSSAAPQQTVPPSAASAPWLSQHPTRVPTIPAQQPQPDFLIRPQMRQNQGTKAEAAVEAAEAPAVLAPAAQAVQSRAPDPGVSGSEPQQVLAAAVEAAATDAEAVKARRRR